MPLSISHLPTLAPNSSLSNLPVAPDDADFNKLDTGSNSSWSSVTSPTTQPDAESVSTTACENVYLTPGHEGTQDDNIPAVPPTGQAEQGDSAKEPIQKHTTYFWECVTFRVEGVMFQLPKYRFVEESEKFMEMVAGVGSEPGSAIELDGVLLSNFESFLKAFLPRCSAMYDEKPQLTKEEWISVLKLSTRWFFNDLRKLAIAQLSAILVDGIERICLAKEYRVYEWLLEGYGQVVSRLTSIDVDPSSSQPVTSGILSTQEGRRIGMDVALALSGIAILRMMQRGLGREMEAREGSDHDEILVTFKDEFKALQAEGTLFLTKMQRVQAQREAEEKARQMSRRKSMKIKQKKEKNTRTEEERQTLEGEGGQGRPCEETVKN